MELDDFFAEYWPAVVGVVVVAIAAFVLFPDEPVKEGIRTPGQVQPLFPGQGRNPTGSEEAPGEEPEEAAAGESEVEAASEVIEPIPEYQFVETVLAIPTPGAEEEVRELHTEDAEVQKALGQVQVDLYERAGCAVCEKARAFMDHNGVRYSRHRVDTDPNLQERARRLSGGTTVPVLVVDGQVLRGFSESSLQGALTAAVKARVVDRN